jgi:hypothetical protein
VPTLILVAPMAMSSYPTWSLRIPLRSDVDPAALRVLEAVARDTPPPVEDLAQLHPVVAYYLGDWSRLHGPHSGPHVGPPLHLTGWGTSTPGLSIEFTQHDDEFANGGWVLWVWLLLLAARPERDQIVVGHEGPTQRFDPNWRPVVIDTRGIDMSFSPAPWDEVEQHWRDLHADPSWAGWPHRATQGTRARRAE